MKTILTYIWPLGSCLPYLGLDWARNLAFVNLEFWRSKFDGSACAPCKHSNAGTSPTSDKPRWQKVLPLQRAKPSTLLWSSSKSHLIHPFPSPPGHNMSVLGSQVDVDMDESVPDPVPKHQGHTGTGCYKLHDHEFLKHRHRPPRKGGGEDEGPGRPNGNGGSVPVAGSSVHAGPNMNSTNLIDLPVDCGSQPNPVQLNSQYALKTKSPPAQRTPVSTFISCQSIDLLLSMFYPLNYLRYPWVDLPGSFSISWHLMTLCNLKTINTPLFLSKMSIELKTYKWDDVDFRRWSGVFS